MRALRYPFELRFLSLTLATAGTLLFAALAILAPAGRDVFAVVALIFIALTAVGFYDLLQTRHAILRNYPIAAHIRFLLETIRPEIRQYFLESDKDGAPYPRDKRAVVYQRAKAVLDKRPFGTQYDVYGDRYEWLHHSLAPKPPAPIEELRVTIGGSGPCTQPYSASVFNISAMSFGALSANAVRALNRGAKMGGFAHDTGEGGVSPYHRQGGDLIWEIGSGYFGCRGDDGCFVAEAFARTATEPQIKMVELKLSQGAKPGHGGVLPAAKITEEISAIRGIPMGKDCISPSAHSAFSTPVELLELIAKMRKLSGGKPAGFKLCIGHLWEFLAICKAMVETDITPDFIVIDGKEGGTGAAPLEFMDHIGMPLRVGLSFAHNALVGTGLRDRIRLGASGRIISAFDMARVMAMGADWCNAARGFMFALGCIQAQSCHTGECPTGVTSPDPMRQRALVVTDKAERVRNFHRNTLHALAELIGAAGLSHPGELRPHHFLRRGPNERAISYAEYYEMLAPGQLLVDPTSSHRFAEPWRVARAESFARHEG